MNPQFKCISNRLSTIIIILLLLISFESCVKKPSENSSSFDIKSAQKEIEARNNIFMEGYKNGDSLAVASCYMSNAKMMPPNEPAIIGKDSILHKVADYLSAGITEVKISTNTLWGNNEMLVEDGNWEIKDKNGNVVDHGKQIEVWKKEAGTWKLFRDCYNSDLPKSSMLQQ